MGSQQTVHKTAERPVLQFQALVRADLLVAANDNFKPHRTSLSEVVVLGLGVAYSAFMYALVVYGFWQMLR